MKRKVTIALLILAAVYLSLCVLLYFAQEAILFPGARFGRADFAAPPNVRTETLRTSSGVDFRVAVGTPRDGARPRGVMLGFVGNGETLASGVNRAAMYAEFGFVTLFTEYPGYGGSGGSASYTSILEAAEASAVRGGELAAAGKLPLVVLGQSLGSFPAVHLAARGIGTKLVLISPPTSILASAQERYPLLPHRLLLRHPFDNLAQSASIRIPTLVVHGDRDRVVDLAMGRELAAAIPGATLHVASGRGHNDLDLSRGSALGAVIAAHLCQ